MKPTVVLDVALLGWAHQRRSYARGVHRVASHTAVGLLESNACELRFVSTSSLAGSHTWLSEMGLVPEQVLFCTRTQLWLSQWAAKFGRWIEITLSDRRLHLRATRWLLQRFVEWADAQAGHIPMGAIDGADIYHSLLHPIPDRVREYQAIEKFLTVVDVIPLTSPESVGGKGVPILNKQLDSLPDNGFALCISRTVREELLKIKRLPADHVFVTPLAASTDVFYRVTDPAAIASALSRHGIPEAPYFLALSSFDPRKNFEHIISCFDAIVARKLLADHNLVIVGSNPERNQHIDRVLSTVGARKRIITPGFVPDPDLAPLYSGAVAFLFPSLSEGFGIPVLEAMQCGTPVISSNAPALPEVVGDAGVLLDPRDLDGWIDAMVRIETDLAFRQELVCRGLERAASFTWKRFIETILSAYTSVVRRT